MLSRIHNSLCDKLTALQVDYISRGIPKQVKLMGNILRFARIEYLKILEIVKVVEMVGNCC